MSSIEYARPQVYQDEPLRELQRFVDRHFEAGGLANVLDAGCGYMLPLDFPRSVRLVGLDVSPDALAKNQNIDVGLVGDIETYPLPSEQFDAILCWTLLEHLDNPCAALANMTRAIRPGGLLIVGIPNIWSMKGLLTKLTPHRFHVWVYRRIFGWEDAGKPGFGPYRTYLRWEIAPKRLARLALAENLERVYASTYEFEPRLRRSVALVWSAATILGRIVTLGVWNPAASEHIPVFHKPLGE